MPPDITAIRRPKRKPESLDGVGIQPGSIAAALSFNFKFRDLFD
jgi:hypothetical protein